MSVRVKKHLPGGTIILDRPDKKNALTRRMIDELQQAFSDLHQERKVRAVILAGAGDAFSAGLDLAEIKEAMAEPDAQLRWHEDALAYQELLETMLRFPKPLLAAVSGPALGAGAGLLLACDVVIAAQDARFGLPEPRRGIVSGLAAPLLAFRVGGGWAANLLLTSRTLDATEAHRIGLFHEVVARAIVWARAQQLVEEIAQAAPESLQLTRRLLYETIAEHLSTSMSAGAAASASSRTTDAAVEGLAAFFEKRPAVWP